MKSLKEVKSTKNVLSAIRSITDKCWDRANQQAQKVYPIVDKYEFKFYEDQGKRESLAKEIYVKELCKLNSEILETIIDLHNAKVSIRAKPTIEGIQNELANRALINDSSEERSDIKLP